MEVPKYISKPKLRELLALILSKKSSTNKLIDQLQEIIKYEDVLFYTWKFLAKIMVNQKKEESEVFLINVLDLLEKIPLPKNITEKSEKTPKNDEVLYFQQESQKFILDVLYLKKCVRKVWECLINKDFSSGIHRKLLLVLLDNYLTHMHNPIFLTDFLVASMNVKGVIGILALQGLAILMQKHNIEYPNVYGKLYMMFEPDIFHMKYKSRLFHLSNIFLSSTHLPEALVASFVKKVSRLSLGCSAPDIIIILKFVSNLLQRHRGLRKMIHFFDNQEVPEDPFLVGENDPMKTYASKSSLWEISLLNNHCQPSVSAAAKFIHSELPSLEFDLNEVLDKTYQDRKKLERLTRLDEDIPNVSPFIKVKGIISGQSQTEKLMFKSDGKRKKTGNSLTFERPQTTIEKMKEDQVYKLWSLT